MQAENNKLLTVKELSTILNLKPETIYQWSWLKKNLPFVKIGKALRVSEIDLAEFIETQKVKLRT
jgi:excisionase family DNA binding protein